MIYLAKNSVNAVTLEVSCLTEYEYFMIAFTPEFNIGASATYITMPNYSTATERFDFFYITESDGGLGPGFSDDLAIFLRPGQYKYEVYANILQIDALNYTNVLELGSISTGRAVVVGSSLNSIYD